MQASCTEQSETYHDPLCEPDFLRNLLWNAVIGIITTTAFLWHTRCSFVEALLSSVMLVLIVSVVHGAMWWDRRRKGPREKDGVVKECKFSLGMMLFMGALFSCYSAYCYFFRGKRVPFIYWSAFLGVWLT